LTTRDYAVALRYGDVAKASALYGETEFELIEKFNGAAIFSFYSGATWEPAIFSFYSGATWERNGSSPARKLYQILRRLESPGRSKS